jgi:hypothetical protein
MPTLYEIGTEFERLLSLIAAADGEVTAELEAALAAVDLADSEKVDAYCRMIRELEGRVELRKAEAARLRDLARTDENGAERMKARLKDHLERTGRQRIETRLFRVWVQASAPSVVYAGAVENLPREFTRIEVKIDKEALHAAAKAGAPLPEGVEIVRGTNLRIR